VLAVRPGPTIGLIMQVVVLAILAATIGLGTAGWLAGVACGLITCIALTRGLRLVSVGPFGPANQVTLTRSALVGGVAALTADSFDRPTPVGVLVSIASVALVLDAVDGQVARRTGTVSALGARFDMEVDAFLILVLSVYVAHSMGAWVLTIGAMRYAFVVAGWALPWMRRSLPPRYWRKVVASIQGIVLVCAAAGVVPAPLMIAAVATALALLVESFGRDVVWLWQHRVSEFGHDRRLLHRRAGGLSHRLTPGLGHTVGHRLVRSRGLERRDEGTQVG
jgi:phosphatidylglycerophosphate synthase